VCAAGRQTAGAAWLMSARLVMVLLQVPYCGRVLTAGATSIDPAPHCRPLPPPQTGATHGS